MRWLVGLVLILTGTGLLLKKKDRIAGGLGDKYVRSGTLPLGVSTVELEKGIRVEMEHTSNPKIAREIAIDHLTEDVRYYDKLEKAGL